MVLTTCNGQVARWEPNAHHHTLIYSWECLKNDTYPRITEKTRIFLRYIGDLFFIWTGTEKQLQSFIEEINNIHPTIKFDSKFSKDEINFLDLTIYKDSNGKLATKVYTKPTDRQSYLYRTSAHPEHLKNSIPYGQALRLKKICTTEVEFKHACDQLTDKMTRRGYKENEIREQICCDLAKNLITHFDESEIFTFFMYFNWTSSI